MVFQLVTAADWLIAPKWIADKKKQLLPLYKLMKWNEIQNKTIWKINKLIMYTKNYLF